jgi:hypothetical protein
MKRTDFVFGSPALGCLMIPVVLGFIIAFIFPLFDGFPDLPLVTRWALGCASVFAVALIVGIVAMFDEI